MNLLSDFVFHELTIVWDWNVRLLVITLRNEIIPDCLMQVCIHVEVKCILTNIDSIKQISPMNPGYVCTHTQTHIHTWTNIDLMAIGIHVFCPFYTDHNMWISSVIFIPVHTRDQHRYLQPYSEIVDADLLITYPSCNFIGDLVEPPLRFRHGWIMIPYMKPFM